MGSLWDITDKDTDQMIEKILKSFKSKQNKIDFVEAVMIGRRFFSSIFEK